MPNRPPPTSTEQRVAARLAGVRLIVLAPVVAVGGVGWWRVHRGDTMVNPAGSRPLLYVFVAAAALAVLGITALYLRWRRERRDVDRSRLSVLAWSATEIPGLLGGAYLFITSDPRPYFGAMFLLVLTFMLFPLPGRR
jgi:hypothetical protein